MTDIASGINWVIQDVQNHNGPAVINVSIGGDKDALGGAFVETAVRNAINAGITVVVAAGNDDMDARENIPAMVGEAITVGATASDDSRAVFGLGRSSNYGPVLDLFAPGGLVPMAYAESDTAGTVNSGTSFSSPYVAGLAARYLEHYPDAIPWQVADAIVSHATQVVIGDAGPGSPNRLAYSRFLDFNPPPPQPPLHQGGGRKMVMAAVTGMSSIPVPTNASRHSVDGKRDLTAVTGTRMIRVPTSAMKMAKYQSGGGNWVPKAASGIPKMMGRISALLRRPHPIHRWRRRRLLH
jgi:subtilisin family serine protease